MSTRTRDFEAVVLTLLQELLGERHPSLELEVPSSGGYARGPRADLVISNPENGSVLAVELKGGERGRHIPFSMLPHVRALKEQIRSDHPESGDVVVVTTTELPEFVRQGLSHDGIAVLEVSSPEEAVERIDEQLAALL
jgi:hypothetical protein